MIPILYKITDKSGNNKLRSTPHEVEKITGYLIENESDFHGAHHNGFTIKPIYNKPEAYRNKLID